MKLSYIRKLMIFLVTTLLSLSAMALDFDQTQRLARQGDATSQFNLGVMYENGDEVEQDYTNRPGASRAIAGGFAPASSFRSSCSASG